MTARLSISALRLASRSNPAIVDDVDLEVAAGGRTALVGESGSGKSLTLLAAAGLLPAGVRMTGGSVSMDGRDLSDLHAGARRALCGEHIGVVFQEPMTALNPVMRIDAQLIESRRRRPGADASRDWCVQALRRMDLPRPSALLRSWPHELSGGMRQRVLVAMALAADPRLVLADEPTTALDPVTRRLVLDRMREAAQEGAGVLLVSHDLTSVGHWADHVVVMREGHVCESGPADRVLGQPVHPYTKGLLACTPTLEGSGPLTELAPLMDGSEHTAQGHALWTGGKGGYRLADLGGGHRIGVSVEP